MEAGTDHDPASYRFQAAGMTGRYHHIQLLSVEMGSSELFAQAGL
jgi:hypothetical protein